MLVRCVSVVACDVVMAREWPLAAASLLPAGANEDYEFAG